MEYNTTFREIIFRSRRIDTGEWIEGNYHHNIRKGTFHIIRPKDSNEEIEVYREPLQLKNIIGEWENI